MPGASTRRPCATHLVACLLVAGALGCAVAPRSRAERALGHARRQAEKGRTAAAIEELGSLLRTRPGYVEAHLLLVDLRSQSARAVVRQELEEKLKQEPRSALLHFLAGYATHEPQPRLAHLREAVELDPSLFHAQLELGRVCRSDAIGDLDASRRAIEAAIALRPQAAAAHLELSRTLEAMGHPAAADVALRRAIELGPHDEAAWLDRVRLARHQHPLGTPSPTKADPVEATLAEAARACPDSGRLWWELADWRWAARQYREAINPLERALRLGPEADYAREATDRLAACHLTRGRLRSARALGHTPWDEAADEMARGALAADAFRALLAPPDLRIAELRNAARRSPRSVLIRKAMGKAAFESGDYKAAVAAYAAALARRPRDSALRRSIAVACLHADDPKAALALLQPDRRRLGPHTAWLVADAEALATGQVPRDAIVARYRAHVAPAPGRQRLLRACIEQFPAYLVARLELAAALREAGDADGARATLQAAAALKGPPLAEAGLHVQLGDAALADKAYPKAIEHYRHAIGLCPDLARQHGSLARALVADGQLGPACDALTRQLALDPITCDLPDSALPGRGPGHTLLPRFGPGDVLRYRYTTDGGQPGRETASLEFDYVIEAVHSGQLVDAALEAAAVTGRMVEGGKQFVGTRIPITCSNCFGLVSVGKPAARVPPEFASLLWLVQFLHGPALPAPRWPGQAWREPDGTALGRRYGGDARFGRLDANQAHLTREVSFERPADDPTTDFGTIAVAGTAAITFDLARHALARLEITTQSGLTTDSGSRTELPPWRHRLELLRIDRGVRNVGRPGPESATTPQGPVTGKGTAPPEP